MSDGAIIIEDSSKSYLIGHRFSSVGNTPSQRCANVVGREKEFRAQRSSFVLGGIMSCRAMK